MPDHVRRFVGHRPATRPSDRIRPDDIDAALLEPDDLDELDGPDDLALESSVDMSRALPLRGRNRDNASALRPKAKTPLRYDRTEEPDGSIAGEVGHGHGAPGSPTITYRAARYESYWLDLSLRSFFEAELITDVLAQVKGGKEANVYRCRAHPNLGVEFLAAKVYRPRRFRSLGNDSLYREGRAVLATNGAAIKKSDDRIMRALGKKTAFGIQVAHTSWLMHEYTTMERLARAGGAVPAAISANENAILMGYVGDESQAAPTLQEVRLSQREAGGLFREVLRNIGLLLDLGLVHGDLSAYNVLYWEGKVTLIDFPQVVAVEGNRAARDLLARDVRRVADYFARRGVRADAERIVDDLWAERVESGGWTLPTDPEE